MLEANEMITVVDDDPSVRKALGRLIKAAGYEVAAALPLAGLTAYRALFHGAGLAKGDRLLVTGAGVGQVRPFVRIGLRMVELFFAILIADIPP